ncbi:MAG: hypothetical protein M3Z16_08405 [Pseudomonadota bacterium]|nr:hypothetical protein [Pseudomonadota bacterium]
MRVLATSLLSICTLLTACAVAPPPALLPAEIFIDANFGPPTEIIDTREVFTASAAMKRFLAEDIAYQLRQRGAQAGLVEALYRRTQLRLEYDGGRTRNAAEAFAARSGNCLSLVIMTAAFAKELNVPVTFQSAYLEETWSRSGSLLFASGHVNVTLGRRIVDARTSRDLNPLTIDFLPPEDIRGLRVRDIDESTVVAMYANNRAAEALAEGRVDDAYAWSRESLRRDPGFLGAYNTLGVVYMRHGDLGRAGQVFELVLGRDERNTRALSNMAEVFVRQGQGEQAAALRQRLAAIESEAPFHYFNLGLAAMQQQDWRTARDYFAREVKRADYYHEFHFWLGLADWQLGDVVEANKHLALAMENSVTRAQHDLYAAKLEWLKSRRGRGSEAEPARSGG